MDLSGTQNILGGGLRIPNMLAVWHMHKAPEGCRCEVSWIL